MTADPNVIAAVVAAEQAELWRVLTAEDDLAHIVDVFGGAWCTLENPDAPDELVVLDHPVDMGWGPDPNGWSWCESCLTAYADEHGL